MEHLVTELDKQAKLAGIELSSLSDEDRLTYALFPQVGLKFLAHRHEPSYSRTSLIARSHVNTAPLPAAPSVATLSSLQ